MKLRTWLARGRRTGPVERCHACGVELTAAPASALVSDSTVNRPEDAALDGRRLLLACGPAHLAVLTASQGTASETAGPPPSR